MYLVLCEIEIDFPVSSGGILKANLSRNDE